MLVELVEPELACSTRNWPSSPCWPGPTKRSRPIWCRSMSAVGGRRPHGRCSTWPWTATWPKPCGRSTACWPPARSRSGCWGDFPSLRRLAAATSLILRAEAAGRKVAVGPALQQAGVKPFVVQKAERQFADSAGSAAASFTAGCLETDLDLKGDSPMPPRLVLERLVVRIAARRNARPLRFQGPFPPMP